VDRNGMGSNWSKGDGNVEICFLKCYITSVEQTSTRRAQLAE